MKQEEHIQLAQEMRTRIKNEFSMEQFIKMHLELYKNLLS